MMLCIIYIYKMSFQNGGIGNRGGDNKFRIGSRVPFARLGQPTDQKLIVSFLTILLIKIYNCNQILSFLQCTVEVTDQGYPEEREDSTVLAISIQRDIELPRFRQNSYSATVSESSEPGTTVAQVQARQALPAVSSVYILLNCNLLVKFSFF